MALPATTGAAILRAPIHAARIARPMNRYAKHIASRRSMSAMARGADRMQLPASPLTGED